MKRLLYAALLLALLGAGSGCAMCGNPWDYAYGAYGGKWQRGDQFNGRVNSAFAPAGGMISDDETVVEGSHPVVHVGETDLEPTAEMMNP